jgi:hypothetical protein
MSGFTFVSESGWRLMTLGIGATVGFAYIINRTRLEPDAQRPNRQVAGWILIFLSLLVAALLGIWVFSLYGVAGGVAALLGSVVLGSVLVLLAGRR